MSYEERIDPRVAGTNGAVREAARGYLGRGWRPVPIPRVQWGPVGTGWAAARVGLDSLDSHFPDGEEELNVGLVLGEPGGGLVDVRLGAEDAVRAAEWFLQTTQRISGRAGRPRSHWWYLVDSPRAGTVFQDAGGNVIVEVRSTGGQTLAPPSLHRSGEPYRWDSEGDPSHTPMSRLESSVRRLAAAVVLGRSWPAEVGDRRLAALALGEGLAEAGWDEEEANEFVEAVASLAGDEGAAARGDSPGRSGKGAGEGARAAGWEALERLVGEQVVRLAADYLGIERHPADEDDRTADGGTIPTQAARVLRLVDQQAAELFHDGHGKPYVSLRVGSHHEVLAVGSRPFGNWVRREAYRALGRPLSTAALEEVVSTVSSRAAFDGREREVFLRVGGAGGKVYIDLGNSDWAAVEVDEQGWRVVPQPPVPFRRTPGMSALPAPAEGGDLKELGSVLNLGGERNWILVVGWMLAALRPTGPYPVLVLHGEQGSAKSTTARGIRSLVDPQEMPLRGALRREQDLAVAARNNWVLGFDNVSHITPAMSDALCQMATGGGFATRQLYTDDEEVQIQASRPVLFTGISPEMVSRPDLLDRALMVELPVISDKERRTQQAVDGDLAGLRPRLFGALLSALSVGLKNLPNTKLDRSPRMADFVLLGEAARQGMGLESGQFRDLIEEVRGEGESQALGLWPVAGPLARLVDEGPSEGTVAELLGRLDRVRQEGQYASSADWPRTAKKLASDLRRYANALGRRGVNVEWPRRSRDGQIVRVSRVGPDPG